MKINSLDRSPKIAHKISLKAGRSNIPQKFSQPALFTLIEKKKL
jgi:hypothetical protein